MTKIGLCGHSTFIRGVRGCCLRCYNAYRKLVLSGATTWATLEAEGKVKRPEARTWGKV